MKTKQTYIGALLTLAWLITLLLAQPVFACMADLPARAQILVKLDLEPRHASGLNAPVEHALQEGDLITINLWPREAVVTILKPKDASQPLIRSLTEADYLTLSHEGGGTAYLDPKFLGKPVKSGPGTEIRRFGAAHAGHVYLRVKHAGRIQLIRLDIAPAKVIPRGTVLRGSETTPANQSLGIGYYDSLELEFPGNPRDGWSVTPAEEIGLKLVAIEAVEVASQDAKDGTPPPRTRLLGIPEHRDR